MKKKIFAIILVLTIMICSTQVYAASGYGQYPTIPAGQSYYGTFASNPYSIFIENGFDLYVPSGAGYEWWGILYEQSTHKKLYFILLKNNNGVYTSPKDSATVVVFQLTSGSSSRYYNDNQLWSKNIDTDDKTFSTNIPYVKTNGADKDASRASSNLLDYLNNDAPGYELIEPEPEGPPEYDPDNAEYNPQLESVKIKSAQWKEKADSKEYQLVTKIGDFVSGIPMDLAGFEIVWAGHWAEQRDANEHIWVSKDELDAFVEAGGTLDDYSIKWNKKARPNPNNPDTLLYDWWYSIPYDDNIFNEPEIIYSADTETDIPNSVDIKVRPVTYDENTKTYSYGNWTTVKNITDNYITQETQNNYQENNEYITNLNTTEYQITNNEGDVINNYYEYTYTTINNIENPDRSPLFQFPDIQLPDVDVDPDLDLDLEDILQGVDGATLATLLTAFFAVFLIFFNMFLPMLNWMPVWARVVFVAGIIVAIIVLIIRALLGRIND